jgi:nucleotide-binding universal stress UspA family protein
MFKRIIAGVDEHQGGRDAIALARHLLDDHGELTLAYVYAAGSVAWRGSGAAYETEQRERAIRLLADARRDAALEARLLTGAAPSVGRGLHGLAEREGADLLVVGSCRRGMLGRVLIADDTRASLNGAPCAVAIAPAGYADHASTMGEIGVAYDGSPESEHALGVARRLAARHGARLSAFAAVRPPAVTSTGGPVTIETHPEALIDRAKERIEALGGVEPHAAYGDAAEELALYGASVDLLIVGSRGYGPLGRLVHGSTSARLARIARCPLLILTRAARDAALSEVVQASEDVTALAV